MNTTLRNVPRKRLVLLAIGGLAVAVLGASAVHWLRTGRFMEETDDAYVRADVVDVRSEITGRIVAVPVRENEFVRAGTPLVEIEPADFETRCAQATAQVAQAAAAVADTTRQIALQEKNIAEARADVAAADAELKRADLEVRRAHELDRKGFASRQRVDNAEADIRVAAARLQQARAKSEASVELLAVIHARADKAKADHAAALEAERFARLQLGKTRIVASVDGVIGNLGARVGAMAQPAVILMHLVPVRGAYVVANYKETQIARMAIGQPAAIRVEGLPDVVFQGEVQSLAPGTGTEFSLLPQDNATGNFNKIVQRVPVRIRVIGPVRSLSRLRSGLSAVPEVDTRHFDETRATIDAARATPMAPVAKDDT
jgi:membrane fusion protein (multidrug efflux system)